MPLTKVEAHNLDNYVVTTEKLSNTAVAAFAQTLTPKISAITETDNTYTSLDDTAMNTAGGYLVITGSDFQSGASVIIDTTTANSTTFVNTSTLQAQVPAKAAGTYNLYVVNPDGGTAIRVNALTYSAFPAFSTDATLANRSSNNAFGTLIAATSDSNITYSNTSTLPAGTTLLSNGWFYGTVSVGVETVYSFTVKATDIELQDTSRTFGLTVTLNPAVGLYAWGENNVGQAALNNIVDKSSPTQVGTDAWSQVSTSLLSSVGVKTNGTLWAWGKGANGQLGLNDGAFRSSPTQVGTGTTWSLVSIGFYNVLATKTDGTLWAWGYNGSAALGFNDRLDRSSPVQVGALTNWSKANIFLHSMAVKTDGTLWTWGANGNGQLGNLSVVARSSPVQVGALTHWSQPSVSTGVSGAVKTDGTLWVWGTNTSGQLGLNSVLHRSSPTQVGTDTNWSRMLLSSGDRGFAVRSTGTLWAFGNGANGATGLNDLVNRSSPTQVGTDTNWNLIGLGSHHVLARKTNGTLWSWGDNRSGQLGQVNVTFRSSPVQVGVGTNWSLVAAGTYTSAAITS